MHFRLLLLLLAPLALMASSGYHEPWGKDADLRYSEQSLETTLPDKPSWGVFLANQVILFHQRVISPVDGPRSHYRPSSSQYMQQAMEKYGFVKGFIMGCDRLLRENKDPWLYRSVEYEGKLYKYDPPR